MAMSMGAPSGGSAISIEEPEYPLGTETITNTLSSDMDAGYKITRRKYTRVIRAWTLKWTMLSGEDYASLNTHFQDAGGAAASWIWTHPQTGETPITVRYKEDVLKLDLSAPGPESAEDAGDGGYYSGSIVLEEV
jgi:hypothetical protein